MNQPVGKVSAAGAQTERRARTLHLREALLAAGASQIAGRGYGGASLADIAAAAGVTKNQLIHHFHSKDELTLAVIARARKAWQDEVFLPAAVFPGAAVRFEQTVSRLGELTRAGWAGSGVLAALCASRDDLPPEVRERLSAILSELSEELRLTLREMKRSGTLALDEKARALAQFVLAAALGSAILAGLGEPFGDPGVLNSLRLLIAGAPLVAQDTESAPQ